MRSFRLFQLAPREGKVLRRLADLSGDSLAMGRFAGVFFPAREDTLSVRLVCRKRGHDIGKRVWTMGER